MDILKLRKIIKEIIVEEYEGNVTQQYLNRIEKYRPLAKKKLKKMGFKVKEIKNGEAFEIIGGDVTKLYLNYISTTSISGKKNHIVGAGEFEAISKIS